MTNAIQTGDFTVIDTETTGLSCKKNEIIEIGAVKFRNWEVADTYDVLIKPKAYIPSYITSITGISNQMVRNSPYFEDVLGEFMSFLESDDIVGHNLTFDLNFLSSSGAPMYTSGFEFHDTLKIARRRLIKGIDVPCHSLGALCEHFRIENAHAHRACDDAKATGELFIKLLEM